MRMSVNYEGVCTDTCNTAVAVLCDYRTFVRSVLIWLN